MFGGPDLFWGAQIFNMRQIIYQRTFNKRKKCVK